MVRHSKRIWWVAGLAAALAAPAAAQARSYGRYGEKDWASKFRILVAGGYDSSTVANTLSFKDGPSMDGWNWELNAAYQGGKPLFFEAGFMGWTLSGGDKADGTYFEAKKAGLAATVGGRFGATEAGVGVIPGGSRIVLRRLLRGAEDGKGPIVQIGIVFPTVENADNYVSLGLGYGF